MKNIEVVKTLICWYKRVVDDKYLEMRKKNQPLSDLENWTEKAIQKLVNGLEWLDEWIRDGMVHKCVSMMEGKLLKCKELSELEWIIYEFGFKLNWILKYNQSLDQKSQLNFIEEPIDKLFKIEKNIVQSDQEIVQNEQEIIDHENSKSDMMAIDKPIIEKHQGQIIEDEMQISLDIDGEFEIDLPDNFFEGDVDVDFEELMC